MNGTTQLAAPKLSVEPFHSLKDCCWDTIERNRPRMLGQIVECLICTNKMKAVEANNVPRTETGSVKELLASRRSSPSAGVKLQALALSKRVFKSTSAAIEFLKKNDLIVTKATGHGDMYIFRQAPPDWFKKGVCRVSYLAPGVLGSWGVRTEESAEKCSTEEDVIGSLSKTKNIHDQANVIEKADADAAVEEIDKQEVPTEASPAPAKAPGVVKPENGKCPEGWELKDGACVETAAAGPGAPAKVAAATKKEDEPKDDVVKAVASPEAVARQELAGRIHEIAIKVSGDELKGADLVKELETLVKSLQPVKNVYDITGFHNRLAGVLSSK